MSTDINVFVDRTRMPSPVQWQREISKAGFALDLDTEFDLGTFSGYLPCTWDGEETGFEFYFDELEDTMFDPADDPSVRDQIGDRDICVGLSVPASFGDKGIAAAAVAAGVLAEIADGVIWVADEFEEMDDPIAWAREASKEFLGR